MARIARLAALSAVLLGACSSDSGSTQRKAAGTPTDPVDVCERLADVCRLDDARLGVCVEAAPGVALDHCEPGKPCYVCQDQH